jgi:hypothetical protein
VQFLATEQQLKQIIFNAIDWSKPPLKHGPYLVYSSELAFKAEDIKIEFQGSWLDLDYVCGRCVKLFMRKVAEGCYEFENEADPERQTWACKYPTNEALIKSVINNSNSNNFIECSPLEGFKDG